MQAYEIGKVLPSFFSPGYELCRASFNPMFFDLIYWLPTYQSDNIHIWPQAHLQYGVYVSHNIPFIVLNFPAKSWSFDISLNIYSMHEELIDSWLDKKDNCINMLLCDCYSNIILEVRKIEIDPYIAIYIREILRQQKQHYKNAFDVQKRIENIMDTMLTEEVLKEITMHKLPSYLSSRT